MQEALAVAVAECNFLAREGLLRVLGEADGIDVTGVYHDADEARAGVRERTPDVLLTAIRMPPTRSDEGLTLAAELGESAPGLAVVVLSRFVERGYTTRLFASGNMRRAYINKNRLSDPGYLPDVIRKAAAGVPTLDTLVVRQIVDAAAPGDADAFAGLSTTEATILAALADGASNAAIARQLDLTVRAVERHVNSIFRKLELEDSGDVNRRVLAAITFTRREMSI